MDIEFCDLSTHYFVSGGIQATLRYHSNHGPLGDGLRVLLCSKPDHERLVRTNVPTEASWQREGVDWVQATLDIPASELEGLDSGEYWLRCERHRDGRAAVVCLSDPFSICLEPRDIPALAASDYHLAEGGVERRSPSSLSGSFVLVEEEDELNDSDDVGCNTKVIEGAQGDARTVCAPFEDPHNSPEGEGKISLMARTHENSFDHSSTGIELSKVATSGSQTDMPAVMIRTAMAEHSTQTESSDDSSALPPQHQVANMSASTTYVSTLSESEISVLKSNNRDLMVKVRKLAEKNRALEQEKETEARVHRESSAQLTARLKEAESQLQLLGAQLSRSDAARAALVSERDGAVAEKVSLAMERDGLCAELLRLRDECAAHEEGRDALRVELQSRVAELECAVKEVKEKEEALRIFNDEQRCMFERCTQLEGKLISKENELRVANETVAQCKREMSKALAEASRRSVAPGTAGNMEGSSAGDKRETTAEGDKPIDSRERSADRSDRLGGQKRYASSSSSTGPVVRMRPTKLHVPDLTKSGASLLPPPPRVKDEFVTGVDSTKIRKHKHPHRQQHYSSPSHLAHDPNGTGLVPTEAGVGASIAPPPTTTGALRKSASGDLRSEGVGEGREIVQCPICQVKLYSRRSEYSVALHVEHCLQKQGEGQGGVAAPTENGPPT